jgi:predicted nuclease with TOPRIM domain
MEFLAKRLGIKLDYNDNKYVEDQIRQLKSKLQKTKSQIEEILDNNRKLIEKIEKLEGRYKELKRLKELQEKYNNKGRLRE